MAVSIITRASRWPFHADPDQPHPPAWLEAQAIRKSGIRCSRRLLRADVEDLLDADFSWWPSGFLRLSKQFDPATGGYVATEWYSNGVLREVTEFSAAGARNGLHRCFYDNGRACCSGTWVAGKRVGVHRGWFANGNLAGDGKWTHGLPEGVHLTWWDNGEIRHEGSWSHGLKEGLHLTRWPNGRLRHAGEWSEGRKIWIHSEFSSDGKLVREKKFQ